MFGRRRFRAPTVNPITRELTDDTSLSNTDAANSKAFIDKLASLAGEHTNMAQEFRRIEAEELANKARSSIDDDWQKRFRAWLVGKPNPEDKGKALWATPSRELNLMRFPSIRKYITSHADARVEFEQMIERMRELGPYGLYGKVDILSTYIYFKYIVAGATINSADWLSDFNTIESTVEMENWKNNGTDGSLYNNNKYRREITDPQTGVTSYVWEDAPTLEPGSYRDWNMTTAGQRPIPPGSTSVPHQGTGKKPVTPPGSPKFAPRFQPQVVTTFLHQSSSAPDGHGWMDAYEAVPDDQKLGALLQVNTASMTKEHGEAALMVIDEFLKTAHDYLTEEWMSKLRALRSRVDAKVDSLSKVGLGNRSSTTGPIRPGSTGSVTVSPMNTSVPRPASSTATPMQTGSQGKTRPGSKAGSSGTGGGGPPYSSPPSNPVKTKVPEPKKPESTEGMPAGLTPLQQTMWMLRNGKSSGLKKTGIDPKKRIEKGPLRPGDVAEPGQKVDDDDDPEPPKGTFEHKNWERRKRDEEQGDGTKGVGQGKKDLTPEELKAIAEEKKRKAEEAMRMGTPESDEEKKERQEKAAKVVSAKQRLLDAGVILQGLNPEKTLAAAEALEKAKANNIPVAGVNGADIVNYVEQRSKKNPVASAAKKKFAQTNKNRANEEKKEEAERRKEEEAQRKRDEIIVKIDTTLQSWATDAERPEAFSSWALYVFGNEVLGIKINQHQVMSQKFLSRLKEEIINQVLPPGSPEIEEVKNASLYGIINEFQGPLSFFADDVKQIVADEEKYIAEHHALLESLGHDVDPLVRNDETDLHWEVSDLITRLYEVSGPNPYDPNGSFMKGVKSDVPLKQEEVAKGVQRGWATEPKLKGQLYREYTEEHNAAIRETVVQLWETPAQDVYDVLDLDEYIALIGWISWIEGVVNDDAEVMFDYVDEPVNIRELAGLLKREYVKPLGNLKH